MKITVKIEVTTPVIDLDLFFWLNNDIENRIFRNCSNQKDSFEVMMNAGDSLHLDAIIYAMNGTDYTLKYSAKKDNGKKCGVQNPRSPIENSVETGNRAHEYILIKP